MRRLNRFSGVRAALRSAFNALRPSAVAVTLTLGLAAQAQAQSWLTEGLLAYYQLNGNANDASGNGNNGVVYGATGTTDRFGNPNGAESFNGINNYIWIGSQLRPPTITVSAWFNTSATTAGGSGGSFPAQAILRDRAYGWSLAVPATGNDWGQPVGALGLSLYRSDPSGPNLVSLWPSGTLYNDGTWHFVAFTYDGTSDSLYIDGTLAASQPFSAAEGIYYEPDGGGGLAIGRDGDADDGYFNGSIDDVRIYDRALSPTEMLDLYLSEVPEPSTGAMITLGFASLLTYVHFRHPPKISKTRITSADNGKQNVHAP